MSKSAVKNLIVAVVGVVLAIGGLSVLSSWEAWVIITLCAIGANI